MGLSCICFVAVEHNSPCAVLTLCVIPVALWIALTHGIGQCGRNKLPESVGTGRVTNAETVAAAVVLSDEHQFVGIARGCPFDGAEVGSVFAYADVVLLQLLRDVSPQCISIERIAALAYAFEREGAIVSGLRPIDVALALRHEVATRLSQHHHKRVAAGVIGQMKAFPSRWPARQE